MTSSLEEHLSQELHSLRMLPREFEGFEERLAQGLEVASHVEKGKVVVSLRGKKRAVNLAIAGAFFATAAAAAIGQSPSWFSSTSTNSAASPIEQKAPKEENLSSRERPRRAKTSQADEARAPLVAKESNEETMVRPQLSIEGRSGGAQERAASTNRVAAPRIEQNRKVLGPDGRAEGVVLGREHREQSVVQAESVVRIRPKLAGGKGKERRLSSEKRRKVDDSRERGARGDSSQSLSPRTDSVRNLQRVRQGRDERRPTTEGVRQRGPNGATGREGVNRERSGAPRP